MAGNYLKAMQLTKQLQKQAEEASKNKDLAETELAAAREQVQAAKGVDAQSTKAEKALAEAEAAFEAKEYKTALDSAQKAKAEALGAYEKRLKGMVDSIENLNSMSTDLGGSSASSVQLTKSAKEAMASGEMQKAYEFARKAWEEAEKTIHEHLSESFSKAQFLIMLAKENGQDTSIPEDFLKRARGHLEENALEEAMGAIEECMDSVRSRLEDHINDSLEETASNIRVAEELEIDPAKAQEILEKAKRALSESDFEESLSLSKQAAAEVSNALSKRVNDLVKRVRERVQEAVEMGCETDKAQAFLDEGKNAAKERSYQQVMDFCRKAGEDLDNVQFQQVLKVISDSRSKFIAAKKAGADITTALDLLNKARDALKEGNFKYAMDCARKGDQSIEDIVETYKNVEEAVVDLDAQMASASKYGVAVDEARVYLERATVEAEGRKFERALELVERGRNVLKKEWMSVINKNTRHIEEALAAAQKLGIEVDESLEELTSVTKRAMKGDFSEAYGDTEAIIARVNIQLAKALEPAIQSLQEATAGKTSSDLESALERVKASVGTNPVAAAKDFLEVRDRAFGTMKASSSELIENLTRTVNLASEFGADEAPLQARLESLREAYSAENYPAVLKDGPVLAKDLEIAIFKSIDAAFTEAKKAVVEVKKTGADIEDLKDELKKVPPLVKGREYFAASEVIKNVRRLAEERKGARDRAYEDISKAAAAIMEAKKSKADIKGPTDFLIRAKKAFEAGEFVKALELSAQAVRSSTEAVQSAGALDRRERVKGDIDLLAEGGVDVDELNRAMAEADSYLASSTFDRAGQLLEEISGRVHAAAVAETGAILAKCAESQKEAAAIGIDVSRHAKDMEDASKALEARDYREAFTKSRKAYKDIERLREGSATAGEALASLQRLIADASRLDIPTAKAKADADSALEALQKGDFEACSSLIEPHLESIMGEAGAKALASIEASERLVAELASAKGVEAPASSDLLVQARRELEAFSFSRASDLAMQAAEAAEQTALQKDMAGESLRTARSRLEEARKKGMALLDAETVLEGAQKLMDSNSYDAAIRESIKVGDIISSGSDAFERVRASSVELDSVIKAVEESGGDSGPLRKGEREAMDLAGKGKTDDALQAMAELMQEAKAVFISVNSVALNSLEMNLSSMQGMGVDARPFSSALARAKKALRDQSVDELRTAMAEAGQKWNDSMTRHALSLIADADVRIINARQKGADASAAEAARKVASNALDAKDYFGSMKAVSAVNPALDEAMAELERNAKDKVRKEAELEAARRSAEEAGRREAEARKKADEETARKMAEESERKARDSAGKTAEAAQAVSEPAAGEEAGATRASPADIISGVEAAIATAKRFGIKVSDAEKAVALARGKLASEPDKAKAIAERADAMVQSSLEGLRPNLAIQADAPPSELKAGEEAVLSFTIVNDKKGLAKDIRFTLKGAEGPLEAPDKLKGGGSGVVRVRVKPDQGGEHRVAVELSYHGILGEETQTASAETVLKVVGGKTATLGQATAAAKCGVCMGGIKPGLQVITCGCGAVYHKPCGDRAGTCKSCGKKIAY